MSGNRSDVCRWVLVIVFTIGTMTGASSFLEGTEWVWANPRPSGYDMWGSASCGGISVAVGDHGTIFSSTDEVNWTPRSSGTDLRIRAVACNGSVFVAVGDGGIVLLSEDGVDWTEGSSGTSQNLWGVEWFGEFLAVGEGPTILSSADGSNWIVRHSESLNQYLWGIASNGSLFVATGGDWDQAYPDPFVSIVMTSSDGQSWDKHTPISSGNGYLNQATWGNDLFVAVHDDGAAYTSPDGLEWTMSVPGSGGAGVTWDGSRYVTTGVAWSSDGADWIFGAAGEVPIKLLFDVDWTGTGYVASGSSGAVLTSADAESWSVRLPAAGVVDYLFEDVVWNGSVYIVCGLSFANRQGVLASSPDGWNWTTQTWPYRPYDVAWGDGRFVAIGSWDHVKTSTDGLDWIDYPLEGMSRLNAFALTWSSSRSEFVAVGRSGVIFTSPDGESWTAQVSNTASNLDEVVCGGGVCVAVGWGGEVLASSDNVVWDVQNITSVRLRDVSHNGSRFVVVGDGGVAFTSTDGESWSAASSGTTDTLLSVGWVGDEFVATLLSGGRALTSVDGQNWTLQEMISSPVRLFGVCEGCPLIVGNNSTILIPCEMTTDTDGDGAGDLCDPCPSDPTDSCNPEESAASIVGGGGGSVANAAGTAAVDLPPAAVEEETSISITSYEPSEGNAGFVVGDGLVPAGNVYDFQPEVNFAVPVAITLFYEQGAMPECGAEETDLDAYWWEDPNWTPQGADQDCDANSLTFATDHFSFYMVGGPDADGDGVPDARDQCDGSNLEEAVVVDSCDSGVANVVMETGCTITDLIGECAASASNHGGFVSCVAHLTIDLRKIGVLSEDEKEPLLECAAQADLP